MMARVLSLAFFVFWEIFLNFTYQPARQGKNKMGVFSGVMQKGKKVKFTTNIDENLLKKIKVKAIQERKHVNKILEELLREYLKR